VGAQAELELLKGISGYAEPTVLMALMGGSGAGEVVASRVLRCTLGNGF
jgi:ABC-type multidrug transport system ATPase subunit